MGVTFAILLFLPLTGMATGTTPTVVQSAERQKVLVFGGNGFIGSELVYRLIQGNKSDIYLVSRGNWYFDSETRIKPFVTHYVCDRENSDLEYCTELMNLVQNNTFKFVFDFSAYRPEVLQESLELLNGKTDLYVYISSDSIYEVCEDRRKLNGGLSKESDAVRPSSEDERDKLNDLDEYGDEKFQGEEILQRNRAAGGSKYLIVRLPDVIGPRDNTERIWSYILWIQFFDFIKVPIFVPKHVQNLKTSYVYVNDVVRAIIHLIEKGFEDEVFNIGFEGSWTLEEFLTAIANELGKQVKFDLEATESFTLFPSVTRGAVDVTKLKETGFSPTDFKTAIHETVEYYKDAFYTQESERDDVVHQLTKNVLGRERKGEFLRFIDEVSAKGPKGNDAIKRAEEL